MKTILCFPADTHSGSTVGLMPPDPWVLDSSTPDEPAQYVPSRAQHIIWEQWAECWQIIKRLRNRGDRVIITMMGDAVDGKHHETSELVTQRTEEQERIFIECMLYALKVIKFGKSDLLQFISGTPIHVGEMSQSERRIANDMEVKIYDRLKCEVNGVKFDLAHDGLSVGRRAWTDSNTLRSVIKSMLFDSLLHQQDMADYVIRAHRHTYIPPEPFERGEYKTSGVVCPAFQLKTNYGSRYTASNNKPPDIGMFLVIVEDDGSHYHLCPRVKFPREKYIKL